MPAYRFHGRLLYFAAYKEHWSLFGVTAGLMKEFRAEVKKYEASGRGTLRFPMDEKVPVGLIGKMAKYRAKENLGKK